MRFALVAVCLTGCLIDSPSDDGTYYPPDNSGWGSGYGGTGGDTSYGCHQDADCGSGLVCARDGECLSGAAVRTIHVNWTVNDMPASSTTCTHAPALAITFISSAQEEFGFAPVPCDAGRYTIDKFPLRFMQVQLSRSGDYNGGAASFFDASGSASLDLTY